MKRPAKPDKTGDCRLAKPDKTANWRPPIGGSDSIEVGNKFLVL
jgi:hypothetical protein